MSLPKNPKKKAASNDTDDTATIETTTIETPSGDTADSPPASSTSRWRRLGLVPGLVIGGVFGIGVALAVPALAGMGDSTPTNAASSTSATPKGDGAAGECSHHKPRGPKHGDKAEGGPANKDKKDTDKKGAPAPPEPPEKGATDAPKATPAA